MSLNNTKILKAIRSSIPLTIKTYKLPHETESQLEMVLELFLKEMNQDALKDSLFYCICELVVNARKANTKRIYFRERGLNISDEEEYEEGMKGFKQAMFDNHDYYLDKQQEEGFYIKVIFHAKSERLDIYVVNNTEITPKEQKRIYDRLARSRTFSSLEEALDTVLDESEGAGLGITIMVLMLRKIGLSENAFDIDAENGETFVRITIPMDDTLIENIETVSEKLISRINNIPQFPENIAAIQADIKNKGVEIQDLARKIATDPALTAKLLKTVNTSTAGGVSKRIDSIQEAVKTIGLKSLRKILYTHGAQAVLVSEKGGARELWAHCYRTAFYAHTIARNILKRPDILDDVYVGGILHDMGKIVFDSTHSNLIASIKKVVQRKGISPQLLESFSTGLNHAEIGAKLAEKWNFPEALVDAIRYHHDPQNASPKNQMVVNTVYVANSLANISESTMDYDQVDPDILNEMGIPSIEHLKKIGKVLSQKFTEEQEK